MRTTLFSTALLGLAALALAFPARPVYAGAVLIYAEPADGAVLEEAPGRLLVWLDRAATVAPAGVSLTDADGRGLPIAVEVAPYQPAATTFSERFAPGYLYLCSAGRARLPTQLTITLPELGQGTYRLSWTADDDQSRRPSVGSLVFRVARAAPAAPAPALVSARGADLLIQGGLSPSLVGDNFIDLRVINSRRPAPAPIARVLVALQPPGAARPLAPQAAAPLAGDHYQLRSRLDRPGTWRLAVSVERPGLPTTTVSLSVEVAGGAQGEALIWLLVGAVGVVGGVAFGSRKTRHGAKDTKRESAKRESRI